MTEWKKFLLVGAGVITVSFAVRTGLAVLEDRHLERAPCEAFRSRKLSDVPLRCLERAP